MSITLERPTTDPVNGSGNGGGQPVLELSSVTKTFMSATPVHALRDVSFTVEQGEFVAIVGQSGSGKSTLMNVMSTLDRPTTGEVFIDGIEVSTLSDKQRAGLRANRIGFIFQSFHLMEGASVLENVANGMVYRGIRRKERLERSRIAISRVGLDHRVDHKPPKLSGGERQRVAIARAIMADPTIVLADEPTGALDTKTSDEIVELLHKLNDEGSTIAVITHDRELADSLPRQVGLRDGQIISDSREQEGSR